ncbi:sialate O-acetylesterase [Chamaesiphon polymorphus]|nr:sialate O-acetylesterase [Chamaesiphon polymorphus]
MEHALYEHELVEVLDDLRFSMKKDKDDYIFTVTENRGHVAMLLVEKSGEFYINERARERLKNLWSDAYEGNMQKLIPDFARQLHKGELPINGVKVASIEK